MRNACFLVLKLNDSNTSHGWVFKCILYIVKKAIIIVCFPQDIAGYQGKIPVAVKTLTSRDPDIIQKFVEEAELMKKFTHPNIVSLLGERSKQYAIQVETAPIYLSLHACLKYSVYQSYNLVCQF